MMAEAKTLKARYIGDGENTVPDLLDAFGTTFEAGKFAEVSAEHAAKLAGNSHFEVQGAKKADPLAETAESTAEFAARVNAITDRDGLEAMAKAEKRPAASNVIERRLEALPPADKA